MFTRTRRPQGYHVRKSRVQRPLDYFAQEGLQVDPVGQDDPPEDGNIFTSAVRGIYNYLAGLDGKYELLSKAQASLEGALEKLKAQDSVDPAAVEKVESALASTKAKIEEINDEYDLVGGGVTALGVIGDLVEKTVAKVGELNEEYELTGKAKEALSGAVSKAKDAAKAAK